ncbi:MAG: Pyridoxal phosphate homeostasis protein [Candidatus Scalindua arabica]|uniref:Pyridoxal phosphate homeostasis protein n=1 Tax=Candidatus Scalindua arabica TaxID=1127984 RepID=A0A941W541_9BACT|nr:Pyridoxal phosphate homeostasis protein [Candidatus Scalindua arabica]
MVEQSSELKTVKKIIEKNLTELQERINLACSRSIYKQKSVELVISTKYVGADIIRILSELGVSCIGENQLQVTERKREELNDLDLSWHMFGHLQRNKVKKAVRIFDLIHSVESVTLAKEINKESEKLGKSTRILVEVNVSGEETKYGLSPEETIPFMREINNLESIKVEGLMTMMPIVDDPETCRPMFKGLRELSERIRDENIQNVEMNILSMGMTQDFEVAIEEGANLVRVGSAVFKGIQNKDIILPLTTK